MEKVNCRGRKQRLEMKEEEEGFAQRARSFGDDGNVLGLRSHDCMHFSKLLELYPKNDVFYSTKGILQ